MSTVEDLIAERDALKAKGRAHGLEPEPSTEPAVKAKPRAKRAGASSVAEQRATYYAEKREQGRREHAAGVR